MFFEFKRNCSNSNNTDDTKKGLCVFKIILSHRSQQQWYQLIRVQLEQNKYQVAPDWREPRSARTRSRTALPCRGYTEHTTERYKLDTHCQTHVPFKLLIDVVLIQYNLDIYYNNQVTIYQNSLNLTLFSKNNLSHIFNQAVTT